MKKIIDYLIEDPKISGQKYALVSIIGPNMPQKCDVWGLKIRGIAESENRARELSKKIMKIDNTCDVYTVEIGKFFPLAVEPNDITDIQYQNEQLNELVKGYLENRELANEHWEKRKVDMIKEATREGKMQEELSSKPEHPIAVLQRIRNYEENIDKLSNDLESIRLDLENSRNKFSNYTTEEKELASKELESAITNNEEIDVTTPENQIGINEIRNTLLDLEPESEPILQNQTQDQEQSKELDNTLNELKSKQKQLNELEIIYKSLPDNSPSLVIINGNIATIKQELESLKEKLNNSNLVNNYINSNYPSSQYNNL